MKNNDGGVVSNIVEGFREVYGSQGPNFISRASGRVELIGGHTDYNEGFVLAAAINDCCWVGTSKRDDRKISFYSQWNGEEHEIELPQRRIHLRGLMAQNQILDHTTFAVL